MVTHNEPGMKLTPIIKAAGIIELVTHYTLRIPP